MVKKIRLGINPIFSLRLRATSYLVLDDLQLVCLIYHPSKVKLGYVSF